LVMPAPRKPVRFQCLHGRLRAAARKPARA
jgi:hypothetical protein